MSQPTQPKRFAPGLWLMQRPRLLRIGVVFVFALASTLAVFPLVDQLYVRWFFDENTVGLPALASAGIGAMMYVLGWVVFVGTAGDTPRIRWITWVYLAIGLLALIVDLVLIVHGSAILNATSA